MRSLTSQIYDLKDKVAALQREIRQKKAIAWTNGDKRRFIDLLLAGASNGLRDKAPPPEGLRQMLISGLTRSPTFRMSGEDCSYYYPCVKYQFDFYWGEDVRIQIKIRRHGKHGYDVEVTLYNCCKGEELVYRYEDYNHITNDLYGW